MRRGTRVHVIKAYGGYLSEQIRMKPPKGYRLSRYVIRYRTLD